MSREGCGLHRLHCHRGTSCIECKRSSILGHSGGRRVCQQAARNDGSGFRRALKARTVGHTDVRFGHRQLPHRRGVDHLCGSTRYPSPVGSELWSTRRLPLLAVETDYPFSCMRGRLGTTDVQDGFRCHRLSNPQVMENGT